MKKKITSLMLIIVATVLVTSCDQKANELKEQVDKYNKACPISFGDIMTLNSVMLNDNTVEMKIIANESIASIPALNNHGEDVKEIMLMSLTKESSKVLVDKIIDVGANLRTVIVGGDSGTRAVFEVTADDLRIAKEKFSNMTEGQKLITSNLLGMKIKLPFRTDEMTTLTGLSLTPFALIYKYEINDREIGNDIEQFGGLLKTITMSQIASQISQGGYMGERNCQLYQALVDCGQSVKVEYYEINTKRRTSFEIYVSELKDILCGKFQENALTMDEWNNLGDALEQLEGMFTDDSVIVTEEYYGNDGCLCDTCVCEPCVCEDLR